MSEAGSRLEKALVPVVVLVLVACLLLTQLEADTVTLVAKVAGIVLILLLGAGLVARWHVRRKRAKAARRAELEARKETPDALREQANE
jgi:ABC-type nickel/cobalt efflux system permease component RcnA